MLNVIKWSVQKKPGQANCIIKFIKFRETPVSFRSMGCSKDSTVVLGGQNPSSHLSTLPFKQQPYKKMHFKAKYKSETR